MDKKLQRLLNQLRKIEEHRERGAYTAIRKEYKAALKDVRQFLGEEYAKLAEDGKLTYEILRGKQEYARFLEEVQQRFAHVGVRETQQITKAVEETYEAAYKGMVDAVSKAGDDREALAAIKFGLSPEVIKSAVENPIAGLTLVDSLEKHRAEIIYNIKKQIGIGLTNGDSMPTMAKRIQKSLEGDYQKAIRIVRTEVHRVREAGHVDAAQHLDKVVQSGKSGKRMTKTWRTMKDERVRPNRLRKTKSGWKRSVGGTANHVKMEGVTVLADELFDLGGNVKALAPGQSGDASNDINCRCIVEYNLMSDEEYFAATGKHFDGQIGGEDANAKTVPIEECGLTKQPLRNTAGYTNTTSASALNEALRYDDDLREFKETIERLDSNMEKIKKPVELYRGTGQSLFKTLGFTDEDARTMTFQQMRDAAIGRSYTEKGYTSTTLDKDHTYGSGVKLVITANDKAEAIWTSNDSEQEVIIRRNQKFKVLDVVLDKGRFVFYVITI